MTQPPGVPASQESGTLFDIQHYAVHDGPGIRTLVFFKGCPLRCLWCCNPESQAFHAELRHSTARCKSCFRCVDLCPRQAVTRGVSGPTIDRSRCLRCEDHPCVDGCWESALAVTGKRYTTAEAVARVARDIDFYRNSGGGVTLSGGEPFSQPDFLLGILQACRSLGIHTAVETCGYGSLEHYKRAAPLVDLFLFDLKLVEPEEHRRATGQSNDLILSNLAFVAGQEPSKVAIRFPVVPGCTDSDENVDALIALVLRLGLSRVDLEPYHTLGLPKYSETGRAPPLRSEPNAALLERVAEIRARMTASGLACEIGRG